MQFNLEARVATQGKLFTEKSKVKKKETKTQNYVDVKISNDDNNKRKFGGESTKMPKKKNSSSK